MGRQTNCDGRQSATATQQSLDTAVVAWHEIETESADERAINRCNAMIAFLSQCSNVSLRRYVKAIEQPEQNLGGCLAGADFHCREDFRPHNSSCGAAIQQAYAALRRK